MRCDEIREWQKENSFTTLSFSVRFVRRVQPKCMTVRHSSRTPPPLFSFLFLFVCFSHKKCSSGTFSAHSPTIHFQVPTFVASKTLTTRNSKKETKVILVNFDLDFL